MNHWWSARLAPLGVPTTDGRVLSPLGRYRLRGRGAPLLRRIDGQALPVKVGRLIRISRDNNWLTGVGVTFDPDTLTLMKAGSVWPQIELNGGTARHRESDGALLIDGRATIPVVYAGRNPAWPDVSFTLLEVPRDIS